MAFLKAWCVGTKEKSKKKTSERTWKKWQPCSRAAVQPSGSTGLSAIALRDERRHDGSTSNAQIVVSGLGGGHSCAVEVKTRAKQAARSRRCDGDELQSHLCCSGTSGPEAPHPFWLRSSDMLC